MRRYHFVEEGHIYVHIGIYIYICIYVLCVSAFYINVIHILINQGDIFFKLKLQYLSLLQSLPSTSPPQLPTSFSLPRLPPLTSPPESPQSISPSQQALSTSPPDSPQSTSPSKAPPSTSPPEPPSQSSSRPLKFWSLSKIIKLYKSNLVFPIHFYLKFFILLFILLRLLNIVNRFNYSIFYIKALFFQLLYHGVFKLDYFNIITCNLFSFRMGGWEINGSNSFYFEYLYSFIGFISRDLLKLLEKNCDSRLLKEVWITFLIIVIFCGILIIVNKTISKRSKCIKPYTLHKNTNEHPCVTYVKWFLICLLVLWLLQKCNKTKTVFEVLKEEESRDIFNT